MAYTYSITTITAILHIFASYLLSFGYWGLFLVAFGSSLALLLPASASLSAAAALAAQGYFNIYLILFVTFVGSMSGDLLGFMIARHYGKQVLMDIHFFRRILISKKYHQVEEYIVDFAPSLIFSSRFMTGVSPATNILAGITKISYKTFITYAVLGEFAYALLYGFAGYMLGSQWDSGAMFLVGGMVAILCFSFVVNIVQVFFYKKNRKNL